MKSWYALCLIGLANAAWAGPVTLSHQARLTDVSGAPLNGTAPIAVQFYDGAEASATPVGPPQLFPDQSLNDGYVALQLVVESDDLAVGELWIEYLVDGVALSPRQRISSVPYAARADSAQRIPTGAPGTCDQDGAITFDGEQETLWICSDGEWSAVRPQAQVAATAGVYRLDDGSAAATCQAYLDSAGAGIPSGYYAIDPAGTGEFAAWCDMETDGGGWTLCFAYDNEVYDSGTWPTVQEGRNKVLARTWGSTRLWGPGSHQGNFCNLMPVSAGSTQLTAEARMVSSGESLAKARFTIGQPNFFTQVHTASSQQFDCIISDDGSARFIYANYTTPSASFNGPALSTCSGSAGAHLDLNSANGGAQGTDGYVVTSFASSGEAPENTLSLHVNWYGTRSSQTLYTTSATARVAKFGYSALWEVNQFGRSGASPGVHYCTTSCGYTNQVQGTFGQRLWVR